MGETGQAPWGAGSAWRGHVTKCKAQKVACCRVDGPPVCPRAVEHSRGADVVERIQLQKCMKPWVTPHPHPHPRCVVDIEGTEIGGEEDFGNNLQN